jgi:hypothetical protein
MLGYEGGKKAYRLLDLETHKIISSWHVKFDEMGKIPPEDLNGFEDDQGDWGDILRHQQPSTSVDEDSDGSSVSGSSIDIEAPQSASPPTDHVILKPVGAPESISAAFLHDEPATDSPSPPPVKYSLCPACPLPVHSPINPPPGYKKAKIRSIPPSSSDSQPNPTTSDCPHRNRKLANQNEEYNRMLEEEKH